MKIVKDLLKCLEEKLKNASDELRVDIGIAISHFQDEEIQNFLTKCFKYPLGAKSGLTGPACRR